MRQSADFRHMQGLQECSSDVREFSIKSTSQPRDQNEVKFNLVSLSLVRRARTLCFAARVCPSCAPRIYQFYRKVWESTNFDYMQALLCRLKNRTADWAFAAFAWICTCASLSAAAAAAAREDEKVQSHFMLICKTSARRRCC